MNVNQKIWLGFGSVLALVGIGSTLGYLKSREAEKTSTHLVTVNMAEFAAASTANEDISMARIYEQRFAATRNEQWIPKLKSQLTDLKAQMKTVQTVTDVPDRANAAASIVSAVDVYEAKFSEFHQLVVRRGLTPESGLEGQLRAAVHQVEAKVKDQGLAELTVLLLMVRRHEKDYLLRGDAKYLEEINTRIKEFAEQMKQFSLPADLQKDIAAKWAGYATAMKSLVDTDQQARQVSAELDKSGDAVEDAVGALSASCSKAIAATQASTLNTIAGGRRTTLILGVVSGVIGAGMAVWIALGLGSLNRGIRRAAEAIDTGSSEIHSASQQLTHSSQSLASGSSEQAASLEETSASLEELSSMTKRNADSAARAKELSAQTRAAAEAGAARMEQMNLAMGEITTSSHDISKIIKTIDEIAFQTNILALNAAVEAARAGEAGAGFAVVAEEVRNLAQRAAQSARETAGKIEGSVAKSEHGANISRQVAESLTEIREKAQEVDTLVAEISQASTEQAEGIAQVNTAVSQMDKVTQTNASAAEESASAAEELNAQTSVLRHASRELLGIVGGRSEKSASSADHATNAVDPVPAKSASTASPTAKNGSVAAHPRRKAPVAPTTPDAVEMFV